MWKRLRTNTGALFGLLVILIAVLVSLLGYMIAPDNSPNADLQTVEIQAKKPGYTQQFLIIPGPDHNSDQNWFTILLQGKKNNNRYIPIKGYRINSDSLLILSLIHI